MWRRKPAPPSSIPPNSWPPPSARTAAPVAAEAETAVHTLLSYIAKIRREGLLIPRAAWSRPRRTLSGLSPVPAEVLNRTFGETAGYDDFVLIPISNSPRNATSHDAVLRQGAYRLYAGSNACGPCRSWRG